MKMGKKILLAILIFHSISLTSTDEPEMDFVAQIMNEGQKLLVEQGQKLIMDQLLGNLHNLDFKNILNLLQNVDLNILFSLFPQLDFLKPFVENLDLKNILSILNNLDISTIFNLIPLNFVEQIKPILELDIGALSVNLQNYGLTQLSLLLQNTELLTALGSIFNLETLINLPQLFDYAFVSKGIDMGMQYGIISSTNLTDKCYDQVNFYLKSLLTTEYGGPFKLWTLLLIDSFFKIPSGIAQGNINWMGDYDQCVDLVQYKPGNTIGPPDFKGEYCLTFVMFSPENEPQPQIYPKLGVCFPSACNTNDKILLLNYWLFLMPFRLGIQESYCYNKDGTPWDNYGTFAVILIGALVLMGIVGTIYESLTIWDEKCNNRLQLRRKVGETTSNVMIAFSYYKNTRKIFDLSDHADSNSISCIHGLKTISMLWVTGVHVVVMTFQDYPWANQLAALRIAQRDAWIIQMFADAAMTTDTFFCIAGLLVTYVSLSTISKLKTKFNVLKFYFVRILRLTPAYAVILAILSGLIVHLGEGPTWALIKTDMLKCQQRWWRNIFYIQNLFPDFYDQCLLPSWYLAVDTQMYFAAPLFLIPLIKKPKMGILLLFVTIIITSVTPAILTYVYDLETYTGLTSRKENMDMFADMLYNKPWNRISTYLIGMLFGYLIYYKGKNVHIKPSVVVAGWFLSTAAICIILFGPVEYFKGQQMPPWLYVMYGGFVRPIWGLCIAWCVYACHTGYGGIMNIFLSSKIMIPISRLSYSFYLSHMLLVHHYYYSRINNLRVEYLGMLVMSFGILVVSLFLAYLLSIVAEAPFIELLNIILKSRADVKLEHRNGFDKKSLKSDKDYEAQNHLKLTKQLILPPSNDILRNDQIFRRRPTSVDRKTFEP